jgi:hypothetical protein
MPERNAVNETVSNTSEATFLNYFLKDESDLEQKSMLAKIQTSC